MAQVVECLHSKCEALSSNPSTTKKPYLERISVSGTQSWSFRMGWLGSKGPGPERPKVPPPHLGRHCQVLLCPLRLHFPSPFTQLVHSLNFYLCCTDAQIVTPVTTCLERRCFLSAHPPCPKMNHFPFLPS
jgi:hypothetical protein